MEIRQLEPADTLASWNLRLRGFEENPRSFKTDADEFRVKPRSEYERVLSGETGSPDDFVLGAFSPELCGQIGFRRNDRRKCAHRATLWGMFVAPEARGQALGAKLVEAFVARAHRVSGLAIVELTVMAENTRAISLYRRFGFERFGFQQRAVKIGDTYLDEEYMMLDIDGR